MLPDKTYQTIKEVLEKARNYVYNQANFAMVQAYWEIGRVIVEEEQKGKRRAEYGKKLIKEISKRLTRDYGKGFDESNLRYIRLFYLSFPKCDSLRHELTWTHYRMIMRLDQENIRNFYMIESINNKWSTRELDRQINSLLYERISLSRDKEGAKKLSLKGQEVLEPRDILKDPFVLEFLDLKENYSEKDVEEKIINRLKEFLLELGKGFSFVGRQKRITVDGDHYYIDLVFYNYLLKCFVLVDLKMGKLTPKDIGQMDFYVRFFDKEERLKEDNPTVGIILCKDKKKMMIKYTLLEESKQVFASKYKLYLPTEDELKKELDYYIYDESTSEKD
ncbi:MAG: PDDEXK nuclease domain-containing protein [archaeon]